MVTFEECIEIGKECGLETIDECILNVERHYDLFFKIDNLEEEMNAFYEDVEKHEPRWFYEHYKRIFYKKE